MTLTRRPENSNTPSKKCSYCGTTDPKSCSLYLQAREQSRTGGYPAKPTLETLKTGGTGPHWVRNKWKKMTERTLTVAHKDSCLSEPNLNRRLAALTGHKTRRQELTDL